MTFIRSTNGDIKAKVSSGDTKSDFLEVKLVAGAGVSITKVTAGDGAETLVFSADGGADSLLYSVQCILKDGKYIVKSACALLDNDDCFTKQAVC